MTETEINFTITIDGTMVVEDPLPLTEAKKEMLDDLRHVWRPSHPEMGEEVTISVEMDYKERGDDK